MNDMIEKLKHNWTAWTVLSKEEQDIFWEAGYSVIFLDNKDNWTPTFMDKKWPIPQSTIFRLSPDYQPEPPKPEYEDVEVETHCNILCIDVTKWFDKSKRWKNLWEIPAMPNFEGFYVNIKGNLLKLCLDDVAKHMNDKPFARFRK